MVSWQSHFESFSWFDQDKVASKLNESSQLCQLVRVVAVDWGSSKASQNRKRGRQLTRCKQEMKSEGKKNEVWGKDSIYVSEKAATGDAHAFLNQENVKLGGVNTNIWITEYIARCNSCWRNKIQRDKRYDEIVRLNALNASWKSVTMDFVTKLLLSKNSAWEVKFDSILIIVNRLTKYTMFILFRETATASVLTYTILRELISNHELSKEFITDRDKLFTSKFWEMLTAELRIKHKMLTAYHSQTDEQSEWMNQTVKTYLWHYVNAKQDNWVWLLPMAQFVYNSARSEIT